MPDNPHAQGYLLTSADRLWGPRNQEVAALFRTAEAFAHGPRVWQAEQDYLAGIKRDSIKQFLVKHQDVQEYSEDDPLLRLAVSRSMLDAAEDVAGESVRLFSAEIWSILPDCAARPREWSHNWHRDPEASPCIKAMLFFRDVTEESGPFEYVAGSHSKYGELCRPGRYADQSAAERIPAADTRRFLCQAGTVLLANTGGIHRGGYTRGRPRLNAVWTSLPSRLDFQPRYSLHPVGVSA